MNVYKIYDNATYWVAAKTMREALDHYWECGHAADDDFVEVERLYPKQARMVEIKVERLINGQMAEMAGNAYDLAQEEGPGVIGCSEWP